jgi:hypothetical protein
MWCCLKHCDVEVFKYLVEARCQEDISVFDNDYQTKLNAVLNVFDRKGRNVLWYAIAEGRFDICQHIMKEYGNTEVTPDKVRSMISYNGTKHENTPIFLFIRMVITHFKIA